MDDPDLAAPSHQRALRGLARINWISGAGRILWRPIREMAARSPRPLRILDIATGGGDLPIYLAHAARRAGTPLEVHACDRSDVALEHARASAARRNVNVRFFQLDALAAPLPTDFDVFMSSLFLHHLSEPEALAFLRRMREAGPRGILINDLRRSAPGWAAAQIAGRVLTRSPVVRVDAVLSVQAAFTPDELRGLAEQAGLWGARVENRWPWRMLLSWRARP